MFTVNEVAVADGFAGIITLNLESNDKDGNQYAYPQQPFLGTIIACRRRWLENTILDNPWRQ